MEADISGTFRVQKTVIAIAEVPAPTDQTRLRLHPDRTFVASDWPAWSLLPFTKDRSARLIPQLSGTWKMVSNGRIELQFERSATVPLGAVLNATIRQGNGIFLKISLNPGNEDDFMVMARGSPPDAVELSNY